MPAVPNPTRRGSFRVWSSATDAARFRRPTDVLLLLGTLIAIALLLPFAPDPTSIDEALATVNGTAGEVLEWAWEIGYALLAVWTLTVVVITALSRGRRGLLLDYLLAAALGLGGALTIYRIAEGTWPPSLTGFATADPHPTYTVAFLGVATAVLVTASPHLTHPLRLLGRAVILVGAIAAVGLQVTSGTGACSSVFAGIAAAAAIHLLVGTPAGRATPAQVADSLLDLGIATSSVETSEVQEPGVNVMLATTADGERLRVKVYGRDAWDGQVVGSVWTALTRRGETPVILRSRVERVDHEAVATLLAERGGVPVVPVVISGRVDGGDALLVTRARGPALDTLGSAEGTFIASAWGALGRLHALGIAHGDIRATAIVRGADGSAELCGFDAATIAADATGLLADRARMLAVTAVAIGPDDAVAHAMTALGNEGLVDVLPYLQPAVVDTSTSRAVAREEWSLGELREAAVRATGTDAPPLLQVRRVTVKSVLAAALIGVIAYTLIGMLAGVDLASVWQELSSADFLILAAALLLSPFVQAFYSVGTMGASPKPLRYWPVLMLQYAIQFIALTLPATAARIALEVRFFQRFGLPAATAISVGVVDSVSGFGVQIALIILILVSGLPGFTSSVMGTSSSTSSTDASSPSVLYLCLALIVIGAVLAVVVPRFRRRITGAIPRLRTAIREQSVNARSALVVLRSPRKVVMMLGGNLGAQVLQAIILGVCLASFGQTAHLSQLILINTAVSLFAGLMPVPGGMGVAEAGYTAGLQAIGIPSAIAISTAIAFRLVTFYLPPIWGGFAMRWLRKSAYV